MNKERWFYFVFNKKQQQQYNIFIRFKKKKNLCVMDKVFFTVKGC